MKTIFTLMLSLLVSVAVAQTAFVHTATAGNISADASFIDHPDLNNNPGAQLVVSHTWNPPGSSGVYNNTQTGVFYSNGQGQWGVYNEDSSAMEVDSSYNIYIDQGSDVTLHIADLANQGSIAGYSVINHPDLNNNPNANIILTTYFNPNGVRNAHNYGVWYDDGDGRWIIYTEDFEDIPTDAAFFIGVGASIGTMVKHQATAGNISGNWTNIDHPLLNGNPDAIFTFTHNWGASGDTANVVIDMPMGVWYTGSNWAIYMEDGATAFPENAEFDLLIYDPSLGIEENNIDGLSYFPNPVADVLTITAVEALTKVTVFNVLGQQVLQQELTGISSEVAMNGLPTGNYLAKIETETASQVIKLVKL